MRGEGNRRGGEGKRWEGYMRKRRYGNEKWGTDRNTGKFKLKQQHCPDGESWRGGVGGLGK